ncbi:MAG: transposase [Sphingomonadaceae bacterium]
MTMSCDDTGTNGVQRFEVFTGAGKRRDWPRQVKASIVAESYSGMESVSAVARRHALVPSQLFTWRRQLREQMEEHGFVVPEAAKPEPTFVPAVIDAMPDPGPAPKKAGTSQTS